MSVSSSVAVQPPIDSQPKISLALVTSFGLGESLIYAALANVLAKNGFEVTLYTNALASLKKWLPHLHCKRTPARDELIEKLTDYDAVICDAKTTLTSGQSAVACAEMAQKYIVVSTSTFKDAWRYDHSHRLKNLSADKIETMLSLAKASGLLAINPDKQLSMVEQVRNFCHHQLHLSDVDPVPGFKIPSVLEYQKYHDRVLIHPTSFAGANDWTRRQSLALARRLKKDGWQVEFTFLPDELERYQALVESEFNVSTAKTLAELAGYIYQSRAMICTHSGLGHLASALNINVLTLSHHEHPNVAWRPGWGPSLVVCPSLVLKWKGKSWWQPFLTVNRAHKAFNDLMAHDPAAEQPA